MSQKPFTIKECAPFKDDSITFSGLTFLFMNRSPGGSWSSYKVLTSTGSAKWYIIKWPFSVWNERQYILNSVGQASFIRSTLFYVITHLLLNSMKTALECFKMSKHPFSRSHSKTWLFDISGLSATAKMHAHTKCIPVVITGANFRASYHNNEHWRVRPPLYEDVFSKLPNGGWRPPMTDDWHARLNVPDENGVAG